MIVTVGGLPGTGTSTLCRLLRDRLGLPYVYAGGIFRDEAAARGMDLAGFGRLCEEDPSVDRALDDRQREMLREGNVLLEGRLSGWLAHDEGVDAVKVWVTCGDDERFRRLAERDGGTPAEQAERTRTREQSEDDRYSRHYGIDTGDLSIYDAVLDSTSASPEALTDQVVALVRSRSSGA